ncbi:Protein of unknown function [Alteromonadaceae bacterium Bs31]|nr:Protein of unknown function [Alteromonadaceae bacterium Bs31]
MMSYKLLSLILCVTCLLSACTDSVSLSASEARLNDTGITWGGNYPKSNNEDCSAAINEQELAKGEQITGDILSQQDCASGRDVLLKNKQSAFEYQKIDGVGKALNSSATQWDCVIDKVSGLMWEVKKPSDEEYGSAGLHDADDRFTWYSGVSSENGGAVGDWNQQYNQCFGYRENTPMSYCNTGEFVSRVNTKGLCGYNDWRLPTRPELETLVHFGVTRPAISLDYFPNTQNDFYWSSSPVVRKTSSAWAVSFQFGFTAELQRTNGRPLRLVRPALEEGKE